MTIDDAAIFGSWHYLWGVWLFSGAVLELIHGERLDKCTRTFSNYPPASSFHVRGNLDTWLKFDVRPFNGKPQTAPDTLTLVGLRKSSLIENRHCMKANYSM